MDTPVLFIWESPRGFDVKIIGLKLGIGKLNSATYCCYYISPPQ